MLVIEEHVVLHKLNSSGNADSENNHGGSSMTTMNYIGLDVHKKTISYCVKDVSGRIQQEGKIGSTRRELDCWMKTLPQPWTVAMEATIFSGWIYDHLLPHATQIKIAPPMRKETSLIQVGLSWWLAPGDPGVPTCTSTGEEIGPASIIRPAIWTPSTSATVMAGVPFCGTRVA